MSRLYSSPGVTNLELSVALVISLGSSWSWSLGPIRGTRHAHRIAVQFDSTQILPYVAVNKDASPTSPVYGAACLKSFGLPKQAQVARVIFQAQYQAFVRFAVGSSAALSAIALTWTCVLEPFTRGGLSL